MKKVIFLGLTILLIMLGMILFRMPFVGRGDNDAGSTGVIAATIQDLHTKQFQKNQKIVIKGYTNGLDSRPCSGFELCLGQYIFVDEGSIDDAYKTIFNYNSDFRIGEVALWLPRGYDNSLFMENQNALREFTIIAKDTCGQSGASFPSFCLVSVRNVAEKPKAFVGSYLRLLPTLGFKLPSQAIVKEDFGSSIETTFASTTYIVFADLVFDGQTEKCPYDIYSVANQIKEGKCNLLTDDALQYVKHFKSYGNNQGAYYLSIENLNFGRYVFRNLLDGRESRLLIYKKNTTTPFTQSEISTWKDIFGYPESIAN